MAAFELPKESHVGFTQPDKKPPQFELDLSLACAPNIFAYMPGQTLKLRSLLDTSAPIEKSGSNSVARVVKRSGEAIDFLNTAASSSSASSRYALSAIGALTTGYVLLEFYADALSGVQLAFAHGDFGAGARLYLGASGANVYLRLGSTAAVTSIRSIAIGEKVTALLTWNSGSAKLFVNGSYDRSYTYSGTAGSTLAGATSLGCFTNAALVDNAFDGKVTCLFAGNKYISNTVARSLTSGPYQLLRPTIPQIYFSAEAAAATTVILGLPSETDTVPGALTHSKTVPIGLSTETDSNSGITPSKRYFLGLATETDSALVMSVSKLLAVGLATETDTVPGALGITKTLAIGIATETDSALAITPAKAVPIGIATETDSALAITRAKSVTLGLATETDAALPLVGVAPPSAPSVLPPSINISIGIMI